MKEYKVMVKYERGGRTITEPWYQRSETPEKALEQIQEHFHNLNDGVFVGADNAEFALEE